MNICMVGYGAIAEKHMEALSGIDDIRPLVLVGRRPDPSAAFARQWRFEHHTLDLDEALANKQVEAVIITSPNEQHFPQSQKTLRAGKHLLLEIPMAMNAADAQRLTALSRKLDRRLMICHSMRYMPAMREVHDRIAQGRLHLHQIVAFFGVLRRMNTTSTGKARSWTDNILWHHAAHLVDLSLWVCGCRQAPDVHCRFGPPHPTQSVMDLHMTMTLPPRVLVCIAESYNISVYRWRVLFIGEEATLEFDDGTLYDGQGKVVVPHRSIVDLHDQDQEFVNAIQAGRDPGITGEDVLPAMETLQKAQASAKGAWAF